MTMKKDLNIPKPCKQEVERYLKEWRNNRSYVETEEALNDLFKVHYKTNNEIKGILLKCCALNDFYGTNIYKIYDVAKHILDLKIDKKLQEGDLSLVSEIGNIDLKNKHGEITHKNFYSFASKYCSHQNEKDYPIYDSYVHLLLVYFKKKYKFSEFKNDDLRKYEKFVSIIKDFKNYFNLDYDYKTLDIYLWQCGKEYFNFYK